MGEGKPTAQTRKRMAPRRARRGPRLLAVAVVMLLTLTGHTVPAMGASGAAPGAPGDPARWTTGAKQGVGTSSSLASKVWFALGQGITHEVYYPQLDVPNVQDLQLMVTDGNSFLDLERDATEHSIMLPDPRALTYQQVNTALSGRYKITKTYVTDPDRATLLIDIRFEVKQGGPYEVYVLFNPSLGNSGMGDTAATENGMLVASDGHVSSALAASPGFTRMTSGYSGTDSSDGYRDLAMDRRLDNVYDTAPARGNVVQTAQLAFGPNMTTTLALAFGNSRSVARANATASLQAGFAATQARYEQGWHQYLNGLNPTPASVTRLSLQKQYDVALMALKAHEDKTYRGANIASLSNPWGQAKNADNCCVTGYQAVWARDLYQVATAQLAAGDAGAANRALDYLFTVQQRPDGSFPQNTRLNGKPVFPSLQLDEVAFPIVLAWQLGRNDPVTWDRVRRAADFLLRNGPETPQERWEEEKGFSPSTIAAEITALVCAADIAQHNGDSAAAGRYLATADEWQGSVERWTFTTNGPLGDGRYYIRIDQDGDPDNGRTLEINNRPDNQKNHEERTIVDAGFLELVRLGVKPPNDPTVAESLLELDQTIMVSTPNGTMFHRYNHDGYGEMSDGSPYIDNANTGVGRLWPLLTGERGEYELANNRSADSHLVAMAGAANDGFMIPEQVWDQPNVSEFELTAGKGTGSATPLAWSMAQFVRLALSIDAGRPVETPTIVASRYAHP